MSSLVISVLMLLFTFEADCLDIIITFIIRIQNAKQMKTILLLNYSSGHSFDRISSIVYVFSRTNKMINLVL